MSISTMLEGTGIGAAESMALVPELDGLPDFVAAPVAAPGTSRRPAGSALARLELGPGRCINCHQGTGVVEIHDTRLFRPGREAFCGELVKAAVERHQVICAEICLTSSICRLEFEPGRFDQRELVDRVAAALSAATPAVRRGWSGASHNPGGSWTTLTAFATDAGASVWETREDRSGQVIVSHRAFETRAAADQAREVPTGSPRVIDLVMAGGSLVLALGGVIVPGIPSLPFLVLTGHYAIRLSPRLRRFLARQPWFIALTREADRLGCQPRLDLRTLLKLAAITVLAAAAFLILHPPLPLVLGLELGLMSLYGLRKLAPEHLSQVGLAACA
jgi:uncharacterized membrane protein YbaN (DUF454 family)